MGREREKQVCLTFLDDSGMVIAQQYCPVGALIEQPNTSQYPSFVSWTPRLPRDNRAAADMTYRMVNSDHQKKRRRGISVLIGICAAAVILSCVVLLCGHASAADTAQIVGTWYSEGYLPEIYYGVSYYTEFRADGTVYQEGWRNMDRGTYEQIDSNTWRATYDDLDYDAPTVGMDVDSWEGYTVTYRYDADTDTLYADYDENYEYGQASDGTLYRSEGLAAVQWAKVAYQGDYAYDSMGNVTHYTEYQDGKASWRESYTYTADGRLETVEYPDADAGYGYRFYRYDEDGNVTYESCGDYYYSYTYNDAGKLVCKVPRWKDGSSYFGESYMYRYDADGNMITELWYFEGRLSGWTEYEYDGSGNLKMELKYEEDGALEQWIEYEYDAENREIRQLHYQYGEESEDAVQDWYLSNAYDPDGNLIQVTRYGLYKEQDSHTASWRENGHVVSWWEVYEYTSGVRCYGRRYYAADVDTWFD